MVSQFGCLLHHMTVINFITNSMVNQQGSFNYKNVIKHFYKEEYIVSEDI